MITIFQQRARGNYTESHDTADLQSIPPIGDFVWIDLESPTTADAEVLSRVFGFHHLAIEDCWHEPQHPKVDDYGDYLFMVVHGVRYDAERDEFPTHELNIFLGPNFLVTFHSFHSRSVEATQGNVRRSPHIMARGMDFMLHQILDRVIDNYFPKLDTIEDKIELLETAVFEHPKPELLTRLFDLRRTVTKLRRVAMQEGEVIIAISRGAFPFVSEKA